MREKFQVICEVQSSEIKHPAASGEVLNALFKLLLSTSLRPKGRGIKPDRD
jgi:hypothetical protein